MKELNHFLLRKGLFASVKGYLFFKMAPSQSRGAGGGPNLLFSFAKRTLLTKRSIPGPFIFLK